MAPASALAAKPISSAVRPRWKATAAPPTLPTHSPPSPPGSIGGSDADALTASACSSAWSDSIAASVPASSTTGPTGRRRSASPPVTAALPSRRRTPRSATAAAAVAVDSDDEDVEVVSLLSALSTASWVPPSFTDCTPRTDGGRGSSGCGGDASDSVLRQRGTPPPTPPPRPLTPPALSVGVTVHLPLPPAGSISVELVPAAPGRRTHTERLRIGWEAPVATFSRPLTLPWRGGGSSDDSDRCDDSGPADAVLSKAAPAMLRLLVPTDDGCSRAVGVAPVSAAALFADPASPVVTYFRDPSGEGDVLGRAVLVVRPPLGADALTVAVVAPPVGVGGCVEAAVERLLRSPVPGQPLVPTWQLLARLPAPAATATTRTLGPPGSISGGDASDGGGSGTGGDNGTLVAYGAVRLPATGRMRLLVRAPGGGVAAMAEADGAWVASAPIGAAVDGRADGEVGRWLAVVAARAGDGRAAVAEAQGGGERERRGVTLLLADRATVGRGGGGGYARTGVAARWLLRGRAWLKGGGGGEDSDEDSDEADVSHGEEVDGQTAAWWG
ncbi:hypothetical protein MMPV_001888 [Pyropia vietnamensis]